MFLRYYCRMWIIALVVKPLSLVALIFLYYVFVYKGSHLIGRFIPEGRIKSALFRERGGSRSRPGRELQ